MKRWNHFVNFPYQEDTTVENWMKLIYRNFDKVVRIMVSLSNDLHCVICIDLSLNYTKKASLGEHYWIRHKKSTAEFVRDTILTKSPDEIKEILDHDL